MNNLKKLFSFSSSERYGIAILSFGVIALLLFNSIQTSFTDEVKPINFSNIESESNTLYNESTYSEVEGKKNKKDYKSKSNYKSNNAIYIETEKSNNTFIKAIDTFRVEINSASVEEFQKLKGIGEVLSKRIIKFKNSIGGFYSIEQLLDVYGVKQEVLDNNSEHLTINNSKLKRISVNKTEFKEMLKHPYLDYNAVKCIFGFRNKSDSVSVQEAITCVADSIKYKLEPYLIK